MDEKIVSTDPKTTERVGFDLGSQLSGGEVIELIGDLGAGKTTFVRGLARGLDSLDYVSSPTFTVCNEYIGRYHIYHCDFYRLQDDMLIKNELSEMLRPDSVVVLEWADEVLPVLDQARIKVVIKSSGDNERKIHISAPEKYKIGQQT